MIQLYLCLSYVQMNEHGIIVRERHEYSRFLHSSKSQHKQGSSFFFINKSNILLRKLDRWYIKLGEPVVNEFFHLKKMGFHAKWVMWIMQCISTVKSSVVVNGEAKVGVLLGRGLRQGILYLPTCLFWLKMSFPR